MYALREEWECCEFCGLRITKYVDYDGEHVYDCGCAEGFTRIVTGPDRGLILRPDPVVIDPIDEDELWAARLGEFDRAERVAKKRREPALNFKRERKALEEAA